ncbi:MAG: T9SS type A sorting domain-containing protein, partial [Chitinophagales bacterium]|nr:T9SS type A sorting domain-containing protein [Chitinophagales bacterium]
SNGCTATASASVTSDTTPPTASVSPSSAVLTCTTTSVMLTASGSGTYLWDDNSTDAARTVTAAGTYTVTVTGTNGCTATASASVTSDTTPPSATISGTASYCVGNTISLSASAGGASYAWSGPGFTANTASISRPSATVAMSGTYTVTVTGSNGCTATASQVVTVNANPTVNITGPTSVCEGNTLTLTASGGTSYSWSGPGGFAAATATMNRTGMTAAMAGTYTVTVTNASGCTTSASRTVAVNVLPAATAGSNSPVCTGTTINLTASGGVTYAWSGPGFSSSLQNPSRGSATLAMAGTYTVTVTNASGCTATASATVAVNSCGAVLNVVSYSIGKDNGTSNGSITLNVAGGTPCTGNTYNYAWSGPSSGSATGGSSFVISPLATGWYTVTITDCAGNSKVVSYFVPLATRGRTKAEGISFDGLTAYPNPTSDVSTIKFTSWSNERMYLGVYSMEGREVAVLFDGIAEEEADYELSLPVSDLAAGVYNVLLVSQSGYRETLRIVVTK